MWVAPLGKAALITPMYISVAWVLMISYQLFTETAVTSLVNQLNLLVPSVGFWLSSRVDLIIFTYAFAWVFVLSSVIPCLILGKERSVLIQFFVCLTLTFLAFALMDILRNYFGGSLDQLFSVAYLFNNPILAALYLSVPYLIMLTLDLRSRRMCKSEEETEILTETYTDTITPEQKYQEE